MTDDTTAGVGHNNPPAYDLEAYDKLSANIEKFNDAAAQYLDLGELETAEQAEKLNDMLTGAGLLAKKVEAQRVKDKKPLDAQVTECQSAYRVLQARIDKIKKIPAQMHVKWLKKLQDEKDEEHRQEQERLAAERAEIAKKAQEAQARNDAASQADVEQELKALEKQEKKLAKGPERARVGSATGAAKGRSIRRVKSAQINNWNKAIMHYRDEPKIKELILTLANRDVRARDTDETKLTFIDVVETDA